MILLILFAFLAGIVTILSPCVLPVLPIILSGTVGGGKRKPFGIVTGFVLSFTFFTLALSTLVAYSGISADSLRTISGFVIVLFGISLILPQFQVFVERFFSRFANIAGGYQHPNAGYFSGVLIGLSLGLIWTPCVGPILASVITLAATSTVNAAAVFITFAYALGTSIPMFMIMMGGRALLQRVPWLLPNTGRIQKGFGILMILTAIGIFFNFDRTFQAYVLDVFPEYGVGLTKFETNQTVQEQLNKLEKSELANIAQNGDQYPMAPDFIPGGEWINSDPLTMESLKGKVVLVDFWTYTCINCIRTFPYTKSWYAKYKDQGFVLVGVHTPEFEFEKNLNNVKKAVRDFGISYPVVQDNDYATWKAYRNRYWPAHYLIDANGRIRHTHFGEGEYDQTERMIQELLKEAGKQIDDAMVDVSDNTPKGRLSPETYLGASRMELYYPSESLPIGRKEFVLSHKLPKDSFELGGVWKIEEENAVAESTAILEYNFYADKVFLVLRPETEGSNPKVKVFLDGKSVESTNNGVDVKDGVVTVDSDRLFELINLRGNPGQHLLRLEFEQPGIEAFAFTFG